MKVVDVPDVLDYRRIDGLIQAVDDVEDGKCLVNARHLRWVDPQGMLSLLSAGAVLRERLGEPVQLQLPESGPIPGYLARMGFFREAEALFRFPGTVPSGRGGSSDVLLEISPVASHDDVHRVVDRVQERAGGLLANQLHYRPTAVVQFSVILSEVCQNIIEHAEAPGWVAAQVYDWKKRLGKKVLVLAVSDLGRGFRGSLGPEHAARFGDRWGDATALEAAFIHGITRFHDSGRGQGIQQMRKQVRRWGGLIAVRSGTARISDVPEWADDPPLEDDLPRFPGAQITILLTERDEE